MTTDPQSTNTSSVEILGFGNPLLDISSAVDDAFMKKYNIKPDNAILAEDQHLPMYAELSNLSTVEYIAGGSTLNTMRMAEWIIPGRGRVGFMGCIGKDNFGEILQKACQQDGVDAHFMVNPKVGTGTCAVCIRDKERSLVANLAAANEFKVGHVLTAKAQAMIASSKLIYNAGFFITVSPDTMMQCAKQCLEQKKPYMINFSAAFIVTVPVFAQRMVNLLPFVTHVFTNEEEAKAFAGANKIEYGNDLKVLAQKIANWDTKRGDTKRTVVITLGKQPVVIAHGGEKEVKQYNVPLINKADIVDLNGAGDAFVGGFLSQFVEGKTEDVCVQYGNYCAGYIIQRSGTSISGKPNFKANQNN